jgi:hypothetical protein
MRTAKSACVHYRLKLGISLAQRRVPTTTLFQGLDVLKEKKEFQTR